MQYYNWGQILHSFILFLKRNALVIILIFNPMRNAKKFKGKHY